MPLPENRQPLGAIAVPGALLRLETLASLAGLSKSTLKRDAVLGLLRVTRISRRCTRVTAEHAQAYLEALARKGSTK
jgi:hypothetical protein